MRLTDTSPAGSVPKRPDAWAIRAIWVVFLATAGFGAWTWTQGGALAAALLVGTELLLWILGIVKIGFGFVVLSAIFSAWPGARSLWLAATVETVLVSVPASIVNADATIYSMPHQGNPPPFWQYQFVHNWPENMVYIPLVAAVTVWVVALYFPKIRGWQFAVAWAAMAVLCIANPGVFPLR